MLSQSSRQMAASPGAQSLLRNEFDIKSKDLNKMSALQWAAKNRYQDAVELLVDKKADIKAKDKN